MNLVLIRPPVVHHRGDLFASIPGIPTGVAYVAALASAAGHQVSILDAYGLAPRRLYALGRSFVARGLTPHEVIKALPRRTEAVGISVHCTAEQAVVAELLPLLRAWSPGTPLIVGGYHPSFVPEEFTRLGADYVVVGEGELRLGPLLNALEGRGSVGDIDGLYAPTWSTPRTRFLESLDGTPLPAVELLPLDNYWKLPYGHGPVRGPYMNVITSRGCPFRCGFCQAPLMSGRRWLARGAQDVVRELEHYWETWGITDFHIQDENFALDRERAVRICEEVIRLGRGFTFTLPSGINAMTLDEELVDLMARAGFRYLSVSPETGSPRVLDLMGKRMDLDRVRRVVRWASSRGMATNACFMLGYPGEGEDDREATRRYLRALARDGLDEAIIPIMTPFPGTASMSHFPGVPPQDLCFSPRWRPDYRHLVRWRRKTYAAFFMVRATTRPGRLLGQVARVLSRRHATKGEMTVTRLLMDAFDWHVRRHFSRLRPRTGETNG